MEPIEHIKQSIFITGGSLTGLTARKGPVDIVLIEDE